MSIEIIDTHCHLYSSRFNEDVATVISRAVEEGVSRFYLPAIDRESHQAMIDLEAAYPTQCFAMMGVHPCSIGANYKEELAIAEEWLGKRSFCAVGEIGLDYYWDMTYKAQQQEAFREQIGWAKKLGLPIVIHARESMDDCIRIVEEEQDGTLAGVFHCFSGTGEQAVRAVATGFYLGIGGVLTFKKSGLDEALADIAPEALVLETDAPYLAPVPFRGKRNESSYLKYVIARLAEVKNSTIKEMARITTQNAQNLFGRNG